jgi:hypothetical protein
MTQLSEEEKETMVQRLIASLDENPLVKKIVLK